MSYSTRRPAGVWRFPVELLEKTGDLWQRLQQGSFDDPALYRVKQVALDLVHANDALLEEARSAAVTGDVAELGIGSLCARYLVRRRDERGMIQSRILTLSYDAQTKEVRSLSHFLTSEGQPTDAAAFDLSEARAAIESSLEAEINAWIPSRQGRIGLNISLVGLHY